ncbi:MAG: TRAP transporter large permease subunit [Deltaproteobacteria bacterium]|nr:TRAP transporter large permease subunit [Deltaproteobacteria bacterium]
MSSELVGLSGVVIVVVLLLFFRMWIGLAMALVGSLGVLLLQGFKQACGVMGTVPYETVAYYPMAALPLFVLMGVIVGNTSIGEDLYYAAYKWVGPLRGGLASATVLACAVFSAITGSSATGTVLMGKVALPQMRKYKYDDAMSSGCIVSAGTMGILIPPSVGLILYGLLTEQSVGKLFMAGFLPGLLLTTLFVIAITITTAFRPEAGPAGPKTTLKVKVASLKRTWHITLLFLAVLGGIYKGIFTPTEAGAVGAFGAFVIAAITGQLTRKVFLAILKEAGATSAMIFLIVIGAFIFMKFLGISKLPFALVETINRLQMSKYLVFAGIVLLYVVLGMFLEVYSAVTFTIPIIFPVIVALGFDPIWFGVIVVLVIEMGLITPPVGMNVFILGGMTGIPLDVIFRGILPFFIAMVVCIFLVTIFPQIALYLPGLMWAG